MTTKHTPGPYEVHYGNGYTRILLPDAATDDYLADVANPDDAPLFAASPELLAALYMALPYVEMAEHDEAYKPNAVLKAVKQMRDAIAKAEGESA